MRHNSTKITDSHVHIFLPERYRFTANRSYTPASATPQELEEHLNNIGAYRALIIQPSPYGYDNRATLSTIKKLGKDRAKGVAVVDVESSTKQEVDRLIQQGIVGLRANLKTSGVQAVDTAQTYIKRLSKLLAGTDSLIEVFLPVDMVIALQPLFRQLGRPVVLDHFAGLKTTSPTLDQDTEQLAELLLLPNMYLKASGASRATNYTEDYRAMDTIAPVLFKAAKDRVIWGSDWPHTGKSSERANRPISEIEPFMPFNNHQELSRIRRWSETEDNFRAISATTANKLLGF